MPKQPHDEVIRDALLEDARSGKPCPTIKRLKKRFQIRYERLRRIVDADDELRPYCAVRRGRHGRVRISAEAVRDTLLEKARSGKPCPPTVRLQKSLHVYWRRFWRIVDADDELRLYFAVRRGRGRGRDPIRDVQLTNRLREIARSGKPCPPIKGLMKRFHTSRPRLWRIVEADDELRPYFAVRRGKRSPAEWRRIAAAADVGAVVPTEAPAPVHGGPPVAPDAPSPTDPPVVLRKDKRPLVLGQEAKDIGGTAELVVKELIEAWPDGRTKTDLQRATHTESPHISLRNLCTDPRWASVLRFPGKRGKGGYRLQYPEV